MRVPGTAALVRIGCAAVLAVALYVILFPIFSVNRWRPSLFCGNHLTQLAIALSLYAEDYDGRLPRAGEWQDASYPYVKSSPVYVCPARPRVACGYAFLTRLGGVNMKRIPRQEGVMILFESSIGVRDANGAGLESFVTPHERRGYIAFLSGRVKTFRKPAVDGLTAPAKGARKR